MENFEEKVVYSSIRRQVVDLLKERILPGSGKPGLIKNIHKGNGGCGENKISLDVMVDLEWKN